MRRKKKTIRFSPGTTAPSSKRLTWMDLLYSLQTKVWKITIWTTPTIQDYFHLHVSTHKDATVKSRIVCLWLSCNKYMFTSSDHKLGLCRISMLSTDTLEAKLWFTSVSFCVVSIVFKKRSESELWASEGPDSDSDLHVDPSFPRVLWPLPNSDEVNKQVDFKMFDFIQLMSNQMWQTADCQSLSSVALASWLSGVITWTWRDNWWRRARGTGNIWWEQQGDCTIYLVPLPVIGVEFFLPPVSVCNVICLLHPSIHFLLVFLLQSELLVKWIHPDCHHQDHLIKHNRKKNHGSVVRDCCLSIPKDQSREGEAASPGGGQLGARAAARWDPAEAGGERAADTGPAEAWGRGGRGESYWAAEEEERGERKRNHQVSEW